MAKAMVRIMWNNSYEGTNVTEMEFHNLPQRGDIIIPPAEIREEITAFKHEHNIIADIRYVRDIINDGSPHPVLLIGPDPGQYKAQAFAFGPNDTHYDIVHFCLPAIPRPGDRLHIVSKANDAPFSGYVWVDHVIMSLRNEEVMIATSESYSGNKVNVQNTVEARVTNTVDTYVNNKVEVCVPDKVMVDAYGSDPLPVRIANPQPVRVYVDNELLRVDKFRYDD